MAARMPARWRRIVRASLTNGPQARSGCPGQPGVEVRRCERGVGELVEQPEFFFHEEGAEHRVVDLSDFAEQRELRDRLLVWCLQQRPSGVLDPAALQGVRALVRVSLITADLVNGALTEAHYVNESKQISACGTLSPIAFS